jgi:hypothetical protein
MHVNRKNTSRNPREKRENAINLANLPNFFFPNDTAGFWKKMSIYEAL